MRTEKASVNPIRFGRGGNTLGSDSKPPCTVFAMSKCPGWEVASVAILLLQAEAEGFLQLRHQFSSAARGVFPLVDVARVFFCYRKAMDM